MKSFTPATGVACYLMTPPSYRPQTFAEILHKGGANLKCFPAHSTRQNLNLIELADGSADVYRLGDDRHDVSLEVTAASDEVMQVLEEIVRRGVPVCVYPRMEGSVQMSLPLIRGIGVDGDMSVAYTRTEATGTKLYMQSPDMGRMVYLTEVDSTAYPLLDGIPLKSDSASVQCPLGRGLFMPSVQKNLLKMSNLNTIEHTAPFSADAWIWTAGGTTWGTHAGQKASPWHDGYSYWTRSTSNYLSSYKFDITVATDKFFNISFCYRVSGTLTAQVYDSAGNPLHGAVTVTTGTGRVQWPVPVISGATSTDCKLRFTLTAGEYAEIAAPQIITHATESVGEYMPYLGSDTVVQGEISASRLLVTGDYGMDTANYVGDGSTWDGYICVSGYVQPGYDVAYRGDKTIAFLEHYNGASVGDIEMRFRPAGSFYELALYSGGTRRAGTSISTPRRGEAFAWVLYTGKTDGVVGCGAYMVQLSSGAIYTTSYAGGVGYANRLYLGCRSTSGYGADSLMSGVTVSSVASAALARNIADRLGNPENADLFRRTAGRWYTLELQASPRRYDRQSWEGSFNCREVKAI